MILLLLALVSSCGHAQEGASTPPAAPVAKPILAIRASESLAAALREGGFVRWALPRLTDIHVEVGPEARGDAEVWLDLLPGSAAVRERLQGLPVELEGSGFALAGTRYAGPSLAVRLPAADKPAWVVLGSRAEDVVELADDILFRLAATLSGRRGGRRWGPLEVDYLLRQTPWMERSGKWLPAGEGRWQVDPAVEKDDLVEWDRWLAGLAPIRGEHAVLLVPPGDRGQLRYQRLAVDLDRAVADMAPRLPVTLDAPLQVIVEPDHVSQGRHTGAIGEAVAGPSGALHLVYAEADLPAYRFALAQALLSKAGLADRAPIALERGAALWLSRDWYGRPYPDWLPLLAEARVLPEPGELLARQEAPDASPVLWTPAAAAVFERLPGVTVLERMAASSSEARIREILKNLGKGSGVRLTSAKARPSLPFLKGISLAMWNGLEGGYHAPSVATQLDRLAGLGANAVSLMPFASQSDPSRPELRYLNRNPGSETDIGLIYATRLARARGFHVLYKPHLWVHGSWTGEVRMTSEADWASWWRSYRRYVLHHAVLASWAGADLFSVGVELSKTTDRDAEWRDLIEATRLFFPGAVTYSGNWYGDLETVRFWDRLDFMGIDAYFPLSTSPQATAADLEKGAKEVAARLATASRQAGKPMILTEVGFAAHKAAWVAPHTEGGEYSEADQAAGYDALFKALGRPPWLAGTFVWKAFSAPEPETDGEADFRFLGRKAEAEVREYYRSP